MAAAVLPTTSYFPEHARNVSLADLPREADSAQVESPKRAQGPSAHVFWKDGASASSLRPSQPLAIPRLKRSMMDSPFAGSASKRPFRSRAFESPPPPVVEMKEEEEPQSLPSLKEDDISTDNLLSRLPSIPTVVTTSSYLQVSVNPVIWRAQEAPGGLVMNVGLAVVQLEGQHDLQLYLWSTMNPRIVTTGIPQPATSGEIMDRNVAEDASDDEDKPSSRTRQGRTYNSQMHTQHSKRERGRLMLEEVFLVRKDPQRRIPDEVFHTCGPFEGGTVMCMPDWPGDIWSFDICCRVADSTSEPIWVKSLDRRLQ